MTYSYSRIIVVILVNAVMVENKLTKLNARITTADGSLDEIANDFREPSTGSSSVEEQDNDDSSSSSSHDHTGKQCAIVVLSNIQTPTMQSLLRKYRYNANGILIPSSVKYFIRMPRGNQGSSALYQLNDRAYSPSGGFVRYYKEVPPIPQAWKR